jgi:pimeloyl-ACP methyl ester carboxylesterase
MMILLYGITFSIITALISITAFVYLAPARATEIALTATRKHSGLVRKEIVLSNNLHFVYLEGGQGEPLMLLHGFGGNKDTFTRVSRFLVKHYRVIIPDIVGFGESAHSPHLDYSPSAQVERLRALSKALNLKQLHLGGNSMGAQIAMLYAAQYPTEVNSLWLLSPAGVWCAPKSDVLNDFLKTGHNPLIARNEKEFEEVMALGMSKPPYVPQPMLKVLAQERIQNTALEKRIFQQMLDQSVENRIRGMETPTLIVFGDQDRVIPIETAKVLSKLLPNSQVVFVQDAGHVAMFEQPQTCARDYLSFRASVSQENSLATSRENATIA